MYYAISDIHGEYEKYKKMLDLIHFSDEDTLFVIGDVCDRGKQPAAVLQEMMCRSNVYPIMGNHDAIAWYLLDKLNTEITEENYDTLLSEEDITDILEWYQDGGDTTASDFRRLNSKERRDILNYMAEIPLYEVVDVGERTFVLIHAGLGNYRKGKKLSEYAAEELTMSRVDPETRFFEDDSVFVIMGHTPTPYFCGEPKIYRNRNNFFIDCGACGKGGRLACLCLDTLEEFYVD